MPDSQIPPLALAFAGFVLALKPDSTSAAVAFVAAVLLFGFLKWLDREREAKIEDLRSDLRALKDKVDTHLVTKGFGR